MHEVVICLGVVCRVVTRLAQHCAPRQVTLGQIRHGRFSVILESRARSQKRCRQRGSRYRTHRAIGKRMVKRQPIFSQRLDIWCGSAVAIKLQVMDRVVLGNKEHKVRSLGRHRRLTARWRGACLAWQ